VQPKTPSYLDRRFFGLQKRPNSYFLIQFVNTLKINCPNKKTPPEGGVAKKPHNQILQFIARLHFPVGASKSDSRNSAINCVHSVVAIAEAAGNQLPAPRIAITPEENLFTEYWRYYLLPIWLPGQCRLNPLS
jgi:hypothetical protein